MFVAVGIGLGAAGNMAVGAAQSTFDTGGSDSMAGAFGQLFVLMVVLQSSYTIFLLGPIVAGFSGTIVGLLDSNPKSAVSTGAAGSFVGFYLMVALGIFIMILGLDLGSGGGGGGSGDATGFGDLVRPMIGAGIPTAIVGAAASYISLRLDSGSER